MPVTDCARWADLPHDLLVRIFAAQPEPLHNLGAEGTCRAWSHAVRSSLLLCMLALLQLQRALDRHLHALGYGLEGT